jgi:cytochrome c553
MTRKDAIRRGVLLITLLIARQLSAEDFAYCTVCHGASGNGNIAIRAPKIAGLEPWYLTRQLDAFGTGIRGGHPQDASGQEMRPIGVRLLHESTRDAAVRFVRSLDPKPTASTIEGDIERGKTLYSTCSACHGARAEGNDALGAPALAAQSDWYLVKQIQNYRLGLRGSDPRDGYGAQMRAIALTLPDEQASLDVIAFINTLN